MWFHFPTLLSTNILFWYKTGPKQWESIRFQNGLILIPVWISHHMSSKVSDKSAHPYPIFNRCTVEVWECVSYFIPHFIMDMIPGYDYLSVLGLRLNHVSKRVPDVLGLSMGKKEYDMLMWKWEQMYKNPVLAPIIIIPQQLCLTLK